MTQGRLETREPVTLKVSPDGEERTFPPGATFTVMRVFGAGGPVIVAMDGTEIKEPEDTIRRKIAQAEKRAARAEKRVDTWRAVVTGVTIGDRPQAGGPCRVVVGGGVQPTSSPVIGRDNAENPQLLCGERATPRRALAPRRPRCGRSGPGRLPTAGRVAHIAS